MRQIQDEAVQLLGVEPFDEAAYDRQKPRSTNMRVDMTKTLSEAVKNAIKELTPEERRRFAELLRRPRRRRPKREFSTKTPLSKSAGNSGAFFCALRRLPLG